MNKCKDCTHFLKDCGFSKADKLLGFDGECIACGQFDSTYTKDYIVQELKKLTLTDDNGMAFLIDRNIAIDKAIRAIEIVDKLEKIILSNE